jgi:hypothetical protein
MGDHARATGRVDRQRGNGAARRRRRRVERVAAERPPGAALTVSAIEARPGETIEVGASGCFGQVDLTARWPGQGAGDPPSPPALPLSTRAEFTG